MILKYSIVKGCLHTCVLCSACEMCVMFRHFSTEKKPFLLFCCKSIFIQLYFCSASLYCKICLGLSHNCFRRIGVLYNKITRIPRHRSGNYLSLNAVPYRNHFGEFNEMVLHIFAGVFTCFLSFIYDRLKVSIVAIVQDFCQISTRPKLYIVIANSFDTLEGIFCFLSEPCCHILSNNYSLRSTAMYGA